MTITARGPSQDQVKIKKKSGSARPESTSKPKLRRKKQPPGYYLGYFGLWWSRMDREGAKEAVESRRRHENAGSSARLRMMLQGCEGKGMSAAHMMVDP